MEDDQRLRTLLLTPWMSPHGVAGWQSAIVLLWQGKAEALESYEATVSSPSVTLAVPAVLRLKKPVDVHKKGVKFSRINVLARDGFRCCYCGQKKTPRELNYDHVVPRSQGGRTVWENIVSACYRCNGRKGNRTPEQAGMRMHFKPHRPHVLPMAQPLLLDLDSAPTQWRPYLGLEAQTA